MVGEQELEIPPWKQGENAALALRLRLGLGTDPVNVWEVIRTLGIALALGDFGAGGDDGRYLKKDSRALIIVNREKGKARQRFTAAHELGHHEMHRYGRENFVIVDENVLSPSNDPVEKAANAFAANFLAPGDGVLAFLGDRAAELKAGDVIDLMCHFGLSYQATVYRLRDCGVIRGDQRDELLAAGEGNVQEMLSERGDSDQSQADDTAADPLPVAYVEQVVKLWKNRLVSDIRFAEMLRLTPEQAEEWRLASNIERPELPDYDDEAVTKLLEDLG